MTFHPVLVSLLSVSDITRGFVDDDLFGAVSLVGAESVFLVQSLFCSTKSASD